MLAQTDRDDRRIRSNRYSHTDNRPPRLVVRHLKPTPLTESLAQPLIHVAQTMSGVLFHLFSRRHPRPVIRDSDFQCITLELDANGQVYAAVSALPVADGISTSGWRIKLGTGTSSVSAAISRVTRSRSPKRSRSISR